MSDKFEKSSFEGRIEGRKTAEPQAPRSISVEQTDKDSSIGRNNVPYNSGSDSQMRGATGNKKAE